MTNYSDNVYLYPEYKLIKEFYKDKKAKRSQLPYMNHIEEGLLVLNHLKVNLETKRAWCLHPVLQMDEDLLSNYKKKYIDPTILLLAMEYRNIANQYLSFRDIRNIEEINLSPIKEVNDMLIADKIQNFKDFILYNYVDNSKADRLHEYFLNWFRRLEINPNFNIFKLSFNMDANSKKESIQYYLNRYLQSFHKGFRVSNNFEAIEDWGLRANIYFHDIKEYKRVFPYNYPISIYIFKDERNKGHFKKHYKKLLELDYSPTFITMPDCHIEEYLKTNKIPYALI